jgi:hypothetical protein
MKSKLMVTLAVGALMITTALPLAVQAGKGNGSGGGNTQLQTRTQTQNTSQQRLRDGSCNNPGAGYGQKKGNTYGTGDGTGPFHPQDGTGYGARNR